MLDTATKKRIDDCRNILVGKLPDPKAQIEQITIGLIYKFMDDMDKEAISLGGAAKFFSGDYEKYSWDSLFDTKVSANEMLGLYSEAIVSMDKNPNIPQLFRDIFKNAYLPYRDPETLKMFLQTIGEFEYTHSEKLGDAFEYLLSVMGSQGDAGQFRTPRHIIDFLVAVVDPGITDTIMDPACGTAGFLISAFKHIKEKNKKGITPDERKKLIRNFAGYDISPDMVRLSLVNLYLHGFSNPHISEYDTLSSEERWNDTYDVILANPPFMSPKGGIRPHKRFTISSNRSEVLFVDYIAEHLNPKGRAGIIVPEGVIFQSGVAYKDLRKMLVENYLYAVVSLPAGIFNPYSGVKTSILLMDKEFAKTTQEILFVKVANDGYNLGAQRNAVKGGQLEDAIEILQQFKTGEFTESEIAHAVFKDEIAKNGDYNLSGERYKSVNILSTNYKSIKLGEVCRIINGRAYKQEELLDAGTYPVLRVGNFFSNRDWYYSILELEPDKYCTKGDLLYAWSASFGPKIWDGEKCIYHYHIWKMEPDESRISKQFLYHVLNKETEAIKLEGGRGIAMMHITKSGIEQREIPLPPLSVQEEIVAEIEGYQIIIDGAKMVVSSYKPKIDIGTKWEVIQLKELTEIKTGKIDVNRAEENGQYPFFTCAKEPYRINEYAYDCEALLLAGNNATADYDVKYYKGKFNAYQRTYIITIAKSEKVLYPYLKVIMDSNLGHLKRNSIGSQTKYLTIGVIQNIDIPLPDIDTQLQIVAQIEKEQELVNANKQLIDIFEQKIKDRIAKVWGE